MNRVGAFRPRRTVALAGLTALAVAVAVPAAAAGRKAAPARQSASSASPNVTTARYSVTLTTSSDWTKLLVSPGTVAATRVRSMSTGARIGPGPRGWYVLPGTAVGPVTITADVVVDENTDAPSFTIALEKGAAGSAQVSVTNTTGRPYRVASFTDRLASPTDPTNRVQVSVARSTMLGSTDFALPRADPRRLTLAFYYPWWDTWYGDPTLADRPADPRSTRADPGVLSLTRQARANGVDGFVVSWAGNEADGLAFDAALAAAGQTGGVVAPYLETTEAARQAAREGVPTATVASRWVGQVLARASSPALLRSGDAVVVFVWDTTKLPPADWKVMIDRAAAMGTPIRLVTDTSDPRYAGVSWGVHRYAANGDAGELAAWERQRAVQLHAPAALDPSVAPRLMAATVSPGFDDSALRGDTNPVVPRGPGGGRYAASWDAAAASSADWVLVTSWNEWFEGTSVEPGVNNGSLALRQTAQYSAQWRAAGS